MHTNYNLLSFISKYETPLFLNGKTKIPQLNNILIKKTKKCLHFYINSDIISRYVKTVVKDGEKYG